MKRKSYRYVESYYCCDICGKVISPPLAFFKLRGLHLCYEAMEHNPYTSSGVIRRLHDTKLDVCGECAKELDHHIQKLVKEKRGKKLSEIVYK